MDGSLHPAYDETVLAGLANDGNPADLRDLLNLFQQNAEATLAAMEKAAQGADWPELQRRAHAMKGSAGQIGAIEIAFMAGGLERHLREGQAAGVQCVAPLREALDRFAVAAGTKVIV